MLHNEKQAGQSHSAHTSQEPSVDPSSSSRANATPNRGENNSRAPVSRSRRSRHGQQRSRRSWTDDDVRAAISGTLTKNVFPSIAANKGVGSSEPFSFSSRAVGRPVDGKPPLPIDDLTIGQFTHSLLDGDHEAAQGLFEDLRQAGFSWAQLALDLAKPAAHRMGAMWSSDAADFASVALGTSLIHRILNQDFHRSFSGLPAGENEHSVVVATLEGDQHVLGATMLERFFQLARWNVYGAIGCRSQDLIALVTNQAVDIVCLSLNSKFNKASVTDMITNMRAQSSGDSLKIIVGGHQIAQDPDLVEQLGFDGSAQDFETAINLATTLVEAEKAG